MIDDMKRRFARFCVAFALLFAPTAGLAQDLDVRGDARLEGYQTSVRLENSGTATTWLLFGLLGLISVAVLFKDAKRSHLD